MDSDRLGRRRSPDQERGLRPLHPLLPEEWTSKAVRVSMSEADWARFEAKVRQLGSAEPTQARAFGATIRQLLRESETATPGPFDWMDWERRKALRLLVRDR